MTRQPGHGEYREGQGGGAAQGGFRAHKQRIKHDPANGLYGDCQRTCLAMVLGLQPEDVPHFADPSLFPPDSSRAAERDWLRSRGYGYVQLPLHGHWGWDWAERVLRQQVGTPLIISGKSPRGEWNHDVVYLDGVIHDPHPDGTGLAGPCIDTDAPADEPRDEGWFWVNAIVPLPVRP